MDKWLRNMNVVKGLAVAIAILLWIVVHMDDKSTSGSMSSVLREQKIYNVSVMPLYDEEQFMVSTMDPAEVTVVLKGSESAVRKISTKDFRVEVDLSRYTSTTQYYPVRVVGLPKSVSAEVVPDRIRVIMEEMQKKEVPVVITAVGTPADGYKAGQPIVTPARVLVTAPASSLEALEFAQAEVSIDKATSTVTKQVMLVAYDKDGKPIDGAINPQVVDVEIPVTSPFKVMPLQIKLKGQPAPGFSVASLTQREEQITVFAPQSQLDKMEFYEGPVVDLTGLKDSTILTLDVPLSNGVTELEQTKVEVSINIVPSSRKTFESIPVIVIGQSEGFKVKLESPQPALITTDLEGAPALLERLNPQDVQAVIDVSNLPPGRHNLPINLNLP